MLTYLLIWDLPCHPFCFAICFFRLLANVCGEYKNVFVRL
uniref:Uncharacterized protein n=1 Tax=Anguilla anguilla TaxID=7936 RepID=A0A0E9WDU3_ANGAN